MPRKFKLAVIIILLMPGFIYGQTDNIILNQQDNIIAPSPTAASLMKIDMTPAGYYTGIPKIEVPIYEVKSGVASFPVTLSYHAGGMRVEENAGWCGTGWDLVAGGVITRQMRGLPDDAGNGYLETLDEFPNPDDGTSSFDTWHPSHTFLFPYADGEKDSDPDLFSFSYPGGSGSFVFGPKYSSVYNDQYGIYLMPEQFIKVEPLFDAGEIMSWKITDENGIIYFYEAPETTTSNMHKIASSVSKGIGAFFSAWYLTKIKSPFTNDSIIFNYNSVNESYTSNLSRSEYNCVLNPSDSLPPHLGTGGVGNTDFVSNFITVNTRKLDEIIYDKGSIKFVIHEGRSDLMDNTGCYLDSIKICKPNGSVLNSFKLNYTYYPCTNLVEDGAEYKEKRLFLLNVSETGSDGRTNPPYVFSYFTTPSLPPKYSEGQDYWGFYNGEYVHNSTHHFIGEYYLGVWYDGAIKEPNITFMKSGTLQTITYPTGGSTSFDYEANDYGFAENSKVSGYTYNSCLALPSYPAVARFDSLKIDHDQYIDLTLGYSDFTLFRLVFSPSVNVSYFNTTEAQKVFIPQGNYSVKINTLRFFEEGDPETASVSIGYSKKDEAVKYKAAGGLRVKKITHYDPVNNKNFTQNFKYTMLEEPARSSGVLNNQSFSYSYLYRMPYIPKTCPLCTCQEYSYVYYVRTNSSQNEIAYSNGSVVGYREVEVSEGDDGSNGKTVYFFTSPYEYQDENSDFSSGFPYTPRFSVDWKRDLPIGKKSI